MNELTIVPTSLSPAYAGPPSSHKFTDALLHIWAPCQRCSWEMAGCSHPACLYPTDPSFPSRPASPSSLSLEGCPISGLPFILEMLTPWVISLCERQLGSKIIYNKILIVGKGKGKCFSVAPGSTPSTSDTETLKVCQRRSLCAEERPHTGSTC